jgi:ATP-dependent Clp protease ATP-binding subunit ClpC
VPRWVAEQGFSPEYGARELRRVVQREIESPLSQLVLESGSTPRGLIRVRIHQGEPRLSVEG